jgi:hypothetical protein
MKFCNRYIASDSFYKVAIIKVAIIIKVALFCPSLQGKRKKPAEGLHRIGVIL